MSDQSQGPGWWQASDGKWYAPELHPDYRPPAAAAPTPPPAPTQPIATPPAAPPTQAFPSGPTGPPATPPVAPPVTTTFPEAAPPSKKGGNAKWIAILAVVLIAAAVAVFLSQRDSDSSSSSGGGSFCDQARVLVDDASLDEAFSDPRKIDSAVSRFDQLVKASPSEIKGDMQTLSDALHTIAGALKSAGDNSESQFAAMFAAMFTLDQTKLEAANGRIDAYAQNTCGFKISSDSS